MSAETMNSLLESWKRRVRENMARRDDYSDGRASAFEACIDELETELSQSTAGAAGGLSMRYFANGPEGSFMADDIALAHLICDGFDREEWTITDTHESTASPPVADHAGDANKVIPAADHSERVLVMAEGHEARCPHICPAGYCAAKEDGNERDCPVQRNTTPPEGQSVEQRARELLADEFDRGGLRGSYYILHPEERRQYDCEDDNSELIDVALRAIAAALSAQFTDNGADAECAFTFQVIRDGVAYCGDCGRTISAQAPSEAVAGIIEGEFGDDGSLSNWQPWRVFRDDDGALWLTTDDRERDIEIDAEQDAAPRPRGVDVAPLVWTDQGNGAMCAVTILRSDYWVTLPEAGGAQASFLYPLDPWHEMHHSRETAIAACEAHYRRQIASMIAGGVDHG